MSPEHPYRVAVVSRLDVLATGLSVLLGRHPDRIEVVDVDAGFGAPDPDVVLYDVTALHDGEGADLERLVKETTSAVIAVSNDLRPDLGSRALALGADGFFSVSVSEDALVGAVVAAAQGAGLDPKILLAANTIGGGLGKIVSPQNLAIASTAVNAPGTDAEILKKAAPYSLGLLVVLGTLVLLASQVGLGV